jgi:hypothetical protein
MLKKLEHDALAADLAAVESLLALRSEDEDPIGFIQFSSRKAEIEEELQRLGNRVDRHAELGIFFGGRPVQGSRGINADFAGRALDQLQTLITKRFSEVEVGGLKQFGRLPLMDRSKMLLTGVVRGSIGFVLEEAGDTAEMVDTPLLTVVDDISDILSRVGAVDEVLFNEAAATLDQRVLATLKDFFVLLDEQQATLRIINRSRDFLLDRHAVARARTRVQAIEIEEHGDEFVGTIFLLPESRRFEIVTQLNGVSTTLTGSVSNEAAAQLAGQLEFDLAPIDARRISQRPWTVEIRTKEIRERNRPPRRVYSLVRLVGEVDASLDNTTQAFPN